MTDLNIMLKLGVELKRRENKVDAGLWMIWSVQGESVKFPCIYILHTWKMLWDKYSKRGF